MRSVELFAGAGGLGMGLSRAGFRHAAVLERDRWACDTLRENQRLGVEPIRHWPEVHEVDVRSFDYGDVAGPVDVVSGGPPCQPFSLGGKHLAHRDNRDMFPEAVRAVRELRPRAFIFENVRGLTRATFARFFEYVYLRLSYPDVSRKPREDWHEHRARLERHHTGGTEYGLTYRVIHQVLNAADFGVPQKRERVFLVGFRSDLGLEWSFPKSTHSLDALLFDLYVSGNYWDRHEIAKRRRAKVPDRYRARVEALGLTPPRAKAWRTVRDALSGLPDPSTTEAATVPNHRFMPGARTYPGHTGSPLDEPAKTLKAGVHGVPGGENMLAMPDGGVRYFTVRESARLQTFPDEYVFHGAWGECMRQLGNAVPVDLAAMVARGVWSSLTLNAQAARVAD